MSLPESELQDIGGRKRIVSEYLFEQSDNSFIIKPVFL